MQDYRCVATYMNCQNIIIVDEGSIQAFDDKGMLMFTHEGDVAKARLD